MQKRLQSSEDAAFAPISRPEFEDWRRSPGRWLRQQRAGFADVVDEAVVLAADAVGRAVLDQAAVLHEVALIVLRAGRPREALRWMLNALQLDPEHVPTHRLLAAYYREAGNPILAARHRALAQRLSKQKTR